MNATTDWYETSRFAADSFQLTEARGGLPCNSFLIESGADALLIDTGLGVGDLREMVAGLTDADPSVLLTHSHWDHIGAAAQFDDVSIDERERTNDGRVTIDVLSEEFLERPEQFVAEWRELGNEFPDGFDPNSYEIAPATGVGTVAPGEELVVGDHTLELLAVPGHSPGQLAAIDHTAGVCYAADVVGIGGNLYAHFQDCDVQAYVESFDRLLERYDAGEFDILTTGHNDPIEAEEIGRLETMRDALLDVLEDALDYETVDTDWGPARQYEVEDFVILTRPDVT